MKMTPIVNINGTSRESLVTDRRNVLTAIDALMAALQETAPHGRDYLGDKERYIFDRSIYATRFATLDKLRNEIQDEALAIQDGDAPASPVRYVLPDETCFDDEGKIPFLVATAPASQELVDHVLTAPTEGNDGRSEWLWIRLPNGDLILGVYPQGDTYMEVEGEASF